MLSAAKVKIHGMQDDRWTIKSKIAQYRGLNALYERDRVIFKTDLKKQKFRNSRSIKDLRNELEVKRGELETAVVGDRQFLRNALQDHRRLQLAYMNSNADKVLDSILQENFNKRKVLDKINYTKKKKMERFLTLQLQVAEIKDRIQYEENSKTPIELKEQLISNVVQCAVIKKNAALAVKGMYIKILDILKKDSNNFTAVLNALKLDCLAQSKCLRGATEMGQLCMEYMDDRKFEFTRLEDEIKKNMSERARSLKMVQDELEFLNNSLPKLIGIEEATTIDDLYDDSDAASVHTAHWELEDVLSTCKNLQRSVIVSKFEDILPRLKEQDHLAIRSSNELLLNNIKKNALIENKNHAILILNTLKNIGQEETKKYIVEKKNLRDERAKEELEEKRLKALFQDKACVILRIRNALENIIFLLKDVGNAQSHRRRSSVQKTLPKPGEVALQAVPVVEKDFDKMLSISKHKITLLLNSTAKCEITEALKYSAKNFYQNLVMTMQRNDYKDPVVAEGSLIELDIPDPSVPDHDMVKLMSQQLVNVQVSEFDVPDF